MIFVIVTVASIGQTLKLIPMVLAAIVALGVVVIIHELGHFISAKKAGVKVETFSVGFGPKLWGIRKGETEYRISLIFFGGYVKMKGMEGEKGKEPHEIEGGFFAARPGRRAFIAFAAPAMNVLLALAVFTLLWFTGRKVPEEVLTTSVGYLEPQSPAEEAGLVPGDTILEVNGQPVYEWKDILFGVAFSPGNSVDLTIRHENAIVKKTILVGWDEQLGVRRLRIYPRMDLVLSEVEDGSLADRLALKKDDRLVSLAGQPLYHIEQFREILRKNIGREVDLVIARDHKAPRELTLPFTVPPPEGGIEVNFVEKGSPAEKAGLRHGDSIVAASGHNISTLDAFRQVLNSNPGKEVQLEVLREKNPPTSPRSKRLPRNTILGASLEEGFPVLGFILGPTYGVKRENPFSATYSAIKHVLLTLKGLVTRRVSTKGISGPVGIVGMIARSISVSFTFFLYLIGFLSANLAVLNLLPIPVVDGGHIMFAAIEKVRGKPIRQRTMTVLVNVFAVLIVAFFILVTKNDIVRFFAKGGKGEPARKIVLSLNVPETGVSPSTTEGENPPAK